MGAPAIGPHSMAGRLSPRRARYRSREPGAARRMSGQGRLALARGRPRSRRAMCAPAVSSTPCQRRTSQGRRARPEPVERTASGPRRQRASIRAAMRGPAVGWFANGLADSRARRAADHRAVLITIPGNARNCSG